MIVRLAGFNVDIENINSLNKTLKKYPDISKEDIKKLEALKWTPETICASYARISRDPRPIDQLREDAREELDKARRSNKAIIFEMGHSSIAEHGIFNFDIINISRLISEKLEKSRLVSFTEKSQRYIKIGNDVLVPEEFKKDKDFLKKYNDLVKELFEAYNILHDKIVPYFLDKTPGIDEKSREYRDIINLAKEDARYILPLSTLTQLGMTVNARSLEKIIRKLSADDLIEANQLAKSLFDVVDGHAPSLVKYTDPTDYETKTYKNIMDQIGNIKNNEVSEEVELVNFDKDLENKVLAAMLLKSSTLNYRSALSEVAKWNDQKKENIFNSSIKYLSSHDSALREFEVSNIEFNIVISATAYAQLKRHRMATMIDSKYSPSLGTKIPLSILETVQKDFFNEKINKIENLYTEAKNKWGEAADYILSNSHRKNVILKCNFRELIHISRLRSDKHAQWDIRNISDLMINAVKDKFPMFNILLCGKDSFQKFC